MTIQSFADLYVNKVQVRSGFVEVFYIIQQTEPTYELDYDCTCKDGVMTVELKLDPKSHSREELLAPFRPEENVKNLLLREGAKKVVVRNPHHPNGLEIKDVDIE